jgi:hypothetical protein
MCVVPIIKIFINSTSSYTTKRVACGLLTSVKSTGGTSSREPPRSIIIRSTRHTRSDAIDEGESTALEATCTRGGDEGSEWALGEFVADAGYFADCAGCAFTQA